MNTRYSNDLWADTRVERKAISRPVPSPRPVPGVIYTAEQVSKLYLLDSPCLQVAESSGRLQVIQTAHLTDEQLLTVPGFAGTRWKYLYTTHEWVPVFIAVDDKAIWLCLDAVPDTSRFSDEGLRWVTPKGFPREQYVWTD